MLTFQASSRPVRRRDKSAVVLILRRMYLVTTYFMASIQTDRPLIYRHQTVIAGRRYYDDARLVPQQVVEKRCGHWSWTMTTFTPSPIIFTLRTVSTRVYGTCTGAAKIISRRCRLISCRVRMSQNIPLGCRLHSFVAMAQNIRSTSCRSMYLRTSLFVHDVVLGPLQAVQEPKLRTPYCTLTWSKYSPRRATTTTALGTCLPSSRRLGFSSDRNITKRPGHPVRSCFWRCGARTVPSLQDAIITCYLNG
jgi:hypothetical protein